MHWCQQLVESIWQAISCLVRSYLCRMHKQYCLDIYWTNFWNIERHNGLTWKNIIDISNFIVWNPVTGTYLILTFSVKLLIDSWCNISDSFNHIFDHDFKCLLESVISADMSEYVPLCICETMLILRLMRSILFLCYPQKLLHCQVINGKFMRIN